MISCICLWRAYRGPFGISLDDGHDALREQLLRLDRLPVLDAAGVRRDRDLGQPWITSSGVPTQT